MPASTPPLSQTLDLRRARLAGNIDAVDSYLVKRYDNLTDLSVSFATMSVSSEIEGVPMVRLAPTAEGQGYVRYLNMPDITPPLNCQFMFLVYIPDKTRVSLTPVWSQAGFTNYMYRSYTLTGISAYNGWHMITFNRNIYSVIGAFNWDTDTVSDMEMRINPVGGVGGYMFMHSAWIMPKPRPKWFITIDDNRLSTLVPAAVLTARGVTATYSHLTLMQAYGFKKATMFVVASMVDGDVVNSMTWAQIRTMRDTHGWDVQVQCDVNAIGNNGQGTRLLGPIGYAAAVISSVDTTTNTLTAAVATGMAATFSFPILFVGTDLPAPSVVGTTYYARSTGTFTFTLHPTAADQVANTNIIDLTTAGIAANFTYRYALAANDDSVIASDQKSCADKIEQNVGVRPKHFAPNQGGIDEYVITAAIKNGLRTCRPAVNSVRYYTGVLPADLLRKVSIYHTSNFIATDTTPTQAAVEAVVDNVIADGGVGTNIHHALSAANGQSLIWLYDYLLLKKKQGLIDVGDETLGEYFDRI